MISEKMVSKFKNIYFASGLLIGLTVVGLLGYLFFDAPVGQAIDLGDGSPECFYNADCSVPYDYCTYGWGPSSCNTDADCSNCGSSVGADYRCSQSNYCEVFQFLRWIPCGQCVDEADPPPPPEACDVTADDFSNALYIKNPNGVIQFAITDGGHLLTVSGNANVEDSLGDFVEIYYDPDTNDNLPIYNDATATMIALFHSDNTAGNENLYLRGSVNEFEINLIPPAPGSFVIKNSAGMVVAYIDPDGNLYLMGCVDDNGYQF